MKFLGTVIVLAIVFVIIVYMLILVGAGVYNMHQISQNMEDLEISIPLGQMVSYMLFTTLCFLLKRYRLGLMVSFAFIFNWGFLHASANFVDATGNPTSGVYIYLASGLAIAVLVLVGFMRNKAQENQDIFTSSADPTNGIGQELDICPTCHQGQGIIANSLISQ